MGRDVLPVERALVAQLKKGPPTGRAVSLEAEIGVSYLGAAGFEKSTVGATSDPAGAS